MQKHALIVGLGIAGMSAAIGLRRAGWTPVIIERAPERRTGGYLINLTPEGMQAAGDLGLNTLHTRDPERGTTWSLNRRGHRRPALGWLDLPGRPTAMVRGDVEAALWQQVRPHGEDGVEVRFATAPSVCAPCSRTWTIPPCATSWTRCPTRRTACSTRCTR